MAITQISRIQHRRGLKTELPQLAAGELGYAVDTQELFIGNGTLAEGAPEVGNTKIITEDDDILSTAKTYTFVGNTTAAVVESSSAIHARATVALCRASGSTPRCACATDASMTPQRFHRKKGQLSIFVRSKSQDHGHSHVICSEKKLLSISQASIASPLGGTNHNKVGA